MLSNLRRRECDAVTRKKRPNQRRIPEGVLQEKIEAAMRALPLPLWASSDFREAQIYTLTEKYIYIYMAFDCVHVETTLTPKQIKSRLSKIEKQSRVLFESLMRLQGPTIEALNSCMLTMRQSGHRTQTLGELQRSLECWIACCAKAPATNSAKLHKGPDRKLIPLKVAKAAACDFHSLTGKTPICSINRDEFPDFLSAVFKALNMDDSVEHFARKASHWWHNERSSEFIESPCETRLLKPTLEGPTGSLPTVQEWIQDQRHGRRDVEE